MQQLPCFNSKNCIPTQKNWIFSHIFEANIFSQRNAVKDQERSWRRVAHWLWKELAEAFDRNPPGKDGGQKRESSPCFTCVCVPAEPLGGVRNLQVLNPTMTTLNVRWEPAEGRVKEYRVIYAPAAGGDESMVGPSSASCQPWLWITHQFAWSCLKLLGL